MTDVVERVVLRGAQGGWRILTIEERNGWHYLYSRAGNSYDEADKGTKLSMGSYREYHYARAVFDRNLRRLKDVRLVSSQLSSLEELALMMVLDDGDS